MMKNDIVLELKIKNISLFSDMREKTIFENVFLNLRNNEIAAIVGNNGVGKTTLLNLISGLSTNTKATGDILFLGKSILMSQTNSIKYVLQDSANCFDPLLTIDYYFKNYKQQEELKNLFEYFLLDDPSRLLKKYPSQLSIGMAQRIVICWGLLYKPKLLLLDEPTSALDITIANLLCNKLRNWCSENNSAILLTTQDINFAHAVTNNVYELQPNGLIKHNS